MVYCSCYGVLMVPTTSEAALDFSWLLSYSWESSASGTGFFTESRSNSYIGFSSDFVKHWSLDSDTSDSLRLEITRFLTLAIFCTTFFAPSPIRHSPAPMLDDTLFVRSALFLCTGASGISSALRSLVPRLIGLREAPLPLTPLRPIREAPLPLIFIKEAPLLFVLFDVEAVEKDGYFPITFYYCYIGYWEEGSRRPLRASLWESFLLRSETEVWILSKSSFIGWSSESSWSIGSTRFCVRIANCW